MFFRLICWSTAVMRANCLVQNYGRNSALDVPFRERHDAEQAQMYGSLDLKSVHRPPKQYTGKMCYWQAATL